MQKKKVKVRFVFFMQIIFCICFTLDFRGKCGLCMSLCDSPNNVLLLCNSFIFMVEGSPVKMTKVGWLFEKFGLFL